MSNYNWMQQSNEQNSIFLGVNFSEQQNNNNIWRPNLNIFSEIHSNQQSQQIHSNRQRQPNIISNGQERLQDKYLASRNFLVFFCNLIINCILREIHQIKYSNQTEINQYNNTIKINQLVTRFKARTYTKQMLIKILQIDLPLLLWYKILNVQYLNRKIENSGIKNRQLKQIYKKTSHLLKTYQEKRKAGNIFRDINRILNKTY